jgi:hypothetical protein
MYSKQSQERAKLNGLFVKRQDSSNPVPNSAMLAGSGTVEAVPLKLYWAPENRRSPFGSICPDNRAVKLPLKTDAPETLEVISQALHDAGKRDGHGNLEGAQLARWDEPEFGCHEASRGVQCPEADCGIRKGLGRTTSIALFRQVATPIPTTARDTYEAMSL